MFKLKYLAGQSLAQVEDGTASELHKVYTFAHVFANLIVIGYLARFAKRNFSVSICHFIVSHNHTIAIYLTVALGGIYDDIVVIIRAEHHGYHTTKALFQHAHHRGSVNAFRFLKLCKSVNQTCCVYVFLCHCNILFFVFRLSGSSCWRLSLPQPTPTAITHFRTL